MRRMYSNSSRFYDSDRDRSDRWRSGSESQGYENERQRYGNGYQGSGSERKGMEERAHFQEKENSCRGTGRLCRKNLCAEVLREYFREEDLDTDGISYREMVGMVLDKMDDYLDTIKDYVNWMEEQLSLLKLDYLYRDDLDDEEWDDDDDDMCGDDGFVYILD